MRPLSHLLTRARPSRVSLAVLTPRLPAHPPPPYPLWVQVERVNRLDRALHAEATRLFEERFARLEAEGLLEPMPDPPEEKRGR